MIADPRPDCAPPLASAPLDPRVAEAVAQILAQTGNVSSAHRFGRRQSAAADEAREHGADRIVMGRRARWERPGPRPLGTGGALAARVGLRVAHSVDAVAGLPGPL